MKKLTPRRLCGAITPVVIVLGGCGFRPADVPDVAAYFNFAAAQAGAYTWSDTTTIDFGTETGRQHLSEGWSIDERWSNRETFVWGVGESSEVRFVRFSRRDLGLRLRCQPLTGPEGPITPAMRIEVNGKEVSKVEFVPGRFHIYEVRVPAEFLSTGENRMVAVYDPTRWKHSSPNGDARDLRVAWDWLEVAPSAFPRPTDLHGNQPEGDLILPLNTRTDYFVDVCDTSRIAWDAIRPSDAASVSGMDLVIEVEPDEGKMRSYSIRVSGSGADAGDRRLRGVRGFSRISFLVAPNSPDAAMPPGGGISIRSPRLEGPAGKCGRDLRSETPTAGGQSEVVTQWQRPNVIVYLIDTLRADHLGVYGYSKGTSPNIDAFSADAVLFERAFAQSSWTKTSVASILTGLLPHSHGTFEREDVLPPIPTYLPQLLRDAGYETVAVSSSTVITADFGFDRGFEEFQFVEPTGDEFPVFAYSDVVTDRFIDWVTEHARSERPFFAYLHTMDPHEPYGPPDSDGGARSSQRSGLWELKRHWESQITAFLESHPEFSVVDVRDHLLGLYDRDISFNDRQFGRLTETLRELGIYDSTIIVLLSDHGEEFLDHGHWTHGQTLYVEQLAIPLLLKLPHQRNGGRRIGATAQHIDVAPTLLEATGLQLQQSMEGRSLLRSIDGTTGETTVLPAEDLVFSNLRLDVTEADSVMHRDLHLIRWKPDSPGERTEMYDLSGDPTERSDLAAQRPAAAGFLRGVLRSASLERAASHQPERLTIEGDVEQRLRALGYIE